MDTNQQTQYNISILPTFKEELNRILYYITYALHNPQAARELRIQISKAIKDRAFSPTAFAPYGNPSEFESPYYRIKVKRHEIFYVVHGDTMEVRRLFYERRNIRKLL